MKILFLAPQPFFQERGTPIAVRLALRVLSERERDVIDLLTYPEGEDIKISGVRIVRIWTPEFLKGVGPGASIKKLFCDIFFIIAAFRMVWRNRHEQYALVHAVEESVFIALLIKWFFGIPYIYDMDSSLALQLTEKWIVLKPIQPVLEWFEKLVVRSSTAVVPVCDALAAIAVRHGSPETRVLSDISLLEGSSTVASVNLKSEAGIPEEATVCVYIGNLERYQGIDLLLESFATVFNEIPNAYLAIIGGREDHLTHYRSRAFKLGINQRVRFLGPRSVSLLNSYLCQADILVSPRTKGNNTPMKIYSYLHSGRVVLATDVSTHTQVLTSDLAELAPPTPREFGAALLKLVNSSERRAKLGEAARKTAEERYTFKTFNRTLNEIYGKVESRIGLDSH